MLKAVCLVTFMVYCASAERISNVESPTWNRRTTEDPYSYGRDRDSESVRGAGSSDVGGSKWGSSGSGVTDKWGDRVTPSYGSATDRYTYSWERSTGGRASYLDGFTTQSPYGGASYDRYSSRRPSYQTDKWGDAVGSGSGSATRSPYDRDRERTDRYGDTFGSVWDRTTSRYGGGSYTTRSWLHSDRDSSGSRYDRNEAYVRIQVELVKFTNDKGLTIDGNKCDTFGQCDPIVRAFLDTERPNAEHPGARDSKYWPIVFQTDDKNTFDFRNANVSRDVCGVPYRDTTLRVLIEDADSISKNDIVNKFDCPITHEPESSETLATWRSETCRPKQQATQMTLVFRYKVYVVPRSRCDPNSGVLSVGGSSTTRRRS